MKSYSKTKKKTTAIAEPMAQYGLKADVHELIDRINDSSILSLLHAIATRFIDTKEPTITLTAAEKKAVDAALKSVKAGRTHSHENVMARMRKKHPALVK